MADDWALGDMAECIGEDWNCDPIEAMQFPKIGQRFIVREVGTGYLDEASVTFLGFIEIGSRYRFDASRFRKIHPKGEDRKVPRRESIDA